MLKQVWVVACVIFVVGLPAKSTTLDPVATYSHTSLRVSFSATKLEPSCSYNAGGYGVLLDPATCPPYAAIDIGETVEGSFEFTGSLRHYDGETSLWLESTSYCMIGPFECDVFDIEAGHSNITETSAEIFWAPQAWHGGGLLFDFASGTGSYRYHGEFYYPIWGEAYSSGRFALTNVVATTVPVPAALPLFLVAIVGLGVVGCRRRTSVPKDQV